MHLFTGGLSITTWRHQFRVGGSQTIFGYTCDSVALDWSLSRTPAHFDGVVTHIHDFHTTRGQSIYNPGPKD